MRIAILIYVLRLLNCAVAQANSWICPEYLEGLLGAMPVWKSDFRLGREPLDGDRELRRRYQNYRR